MSDSLIPTDAPGPLQERLLVALPRLRAHLNARRPGIPGGDVDDVVQEVMARALRYQGSFDGTLALWPWLRRMAEHVLHDQHSTAIRLPELSEELDPSAPEIDAPLDVRDEVERLLIQLPERERSVLLRFHQHEHSVSKIACDLGLPEGTVKSHLSRARRRLAGLDDLGGRGAGAARSRRETT
ncbi:MAG: RNA polymerase sigma factor (sigma-70 family) [Chlamydiales bacterium]